MISSVESKIRKEQWEGEKLLLQQPFLYFECLFVEIYHNFGGLGSEKSSNIGHNFIHHQSQEEKRSKEIHVYILC